MLEISRVLSLDRLSQKMSSDDSRGTVKTKKKSETAPANGSGKGTTPVSRSSNKKVYSSTINFEYVPSGKIHMNREARNRIVDFFQ